MFDKILIANRGEIACRVMRTAKLMGIKTVAVYSDADARAPHVLMADEAVLIGPAPAAQSYLIIDKIIDACKQSGAQAVHPGYGFLSENAAFAEALAKAGIAFIGPNVKAIQVMGDKIESKKFANDAKVNTVPGYLGEIDTPEDAIKIAGDIGYPVMIKASAGGGGKGMRVAHSAGEVEEGFQLAKIGKPDRLSGTIVSLLKSLLSSPAISKFRCLAINTVMRFTWARGNVPSSAATRKSLKKPLLHFWMKKTRKAMGEQAVALAKAVDYESAGYCGILSSTRTRISISWR